jgi:hypothetical protein
MAPIVKWLEPLGAVAAYGVVKVGGDPSNRHRLSPRAASRPTRIPSKLVWLLAFHLVLNDDGCMRF